MQTPLQSCKDETIRFEDKKLKTAMAGYFDRKIA